MINYKNGFEVLVWWSMYVTPVVACPSEEVLSRIAEFKNLFIGELHGTVETPGFVKCVVDRKIQMGKASIIVSLELPAMAEDESSEFWNRSETSQDGRSSEAMHELYVYLDEKDNEGLISLRLDDGARFSPGKFADEMKDLSKDHDLILYRGNAHSAKSADDELPPRIGALLGPSFIHIAVMAGEGGTYWACAPVCGVQSLAGYSNQAIPHGALVDGTSLNHDYIYLLESRSFTTSPPWRR